MTTVADARPARTAPPAPGTIALVALADDYTVGPAPGREVLVGRNRPEVHLCVGESDTGISRCHVVLRHGDDGWAVQRTGRREVRLGRDRRLWRGGEPVPLPPGYTSLVLTGSGDRVHIVEVAVAGLHGWAVPRWDELTLSAGTVDLTTDEKLVLAALGERYLLDERGPRPRSWRQVADRVLAVRPGGPFGHRQVERMVLGLRLRLSAAGAHGLVSPEVEDPGETLKHNLITLLIASGSIGPHDLEALDPPG